MEKFAQQQSWELTAPALQGLLLPSPLLYELPKYAAQPTLLDPSHCRLCLQPVPPGHLAEHLLSSEHHPGLTESQYRRFVLRQTLSEWPQIIPSQVLRTRLAAFKEELCDANYLEKPCASCCRLKRQSKLFRVRFPTATCDAAPAWLPWDDAGWQQHRCAWLQQVDDMLDIESYLRRFFQTSERLAMAQRELLAFEPDSKITSDFPTVEAASSWIRRRPFFLKKT